MKMNAKTVLREFTENKELMSEQKVVVKPAGHKGNGLFAKVDIKKGEMILKAKVKIIDNDDWKLVKNTEVVKLYTLVWGDEHGIPVGPWEFEFKSQQDKRKWDEAGLLDNGKLMISGFLYINDIDGQTEANSDEWFDADGKLAGMIALRDIKAGEEIIKEYDDTMAGKWRKDLKEGLNLVKKTMPEFEYWIKHLLDTLQPAISVDYPNSIFFKRDNVIFLEYIRYTKWLWIDYNKIIRPLFRKFGVDAPDANRIITRLINKQYRSIHPLRCLTSNDRSRMVWEHITNWVDFRPL